MLHRGQRVLFPAKDCPIRQGASSICPSPTHNRECDLFPRPTRRGSSATVTRVPVLIQNLDRDRSPDFRANQTESGYTHRRTF
jgi:hypothetical protein